LVTFSAILLAATWGIQADAQKRLPSVTVRAMSHSYHNAPVTIAAPAGVPTGYLMLTPNRGQGGTPLRAQSSHSGGKPTLTFILDDLAKGASRTYKLGSVVFVRAPDKQVEVSQRGDDVEILVDKQLFTRYATKSGPNKPFFYPIMTPAGTHMTRRWPVEPDADQKESHDHPHHRGLWFAHSKMNGIDFWSEEKNHGNSVTTGFERIESGWVYGSFAALTEWHMPDGKLIANDRREVRIYPLPNGDRILDFSVTLTALGGPLTFGDNKDGLFGLRVPDSLALHADRSSKIKGEGHIETASGENDAAAWGKPNNWVDYWGPIEGKTFGVAIFDAAANLRHPETWHARDYALFTVNPFGLHDFGRGDKGAGDYTLDADKSIVFTYRLLFHAGDTKSAMVAEQYDNFNDGPTVILKDSGLTRGSK